MGIFTGIGLVTPDASRYKKAIRSLENRRAKMMVMSAQNAIKLREKEDPREQAGLKQTAFARGIGKSTIYDQDKERLDLIQSQRNAMLKQQLAYARKYKTMIKRKHHWEKISQYYEMIDGIIGLASGATHSSSASYDGGGEFGGGGDWGGGQGGDFNYGGAG